MRETQALTTGGDLILLNGSYLDTRLTEVLCRAGVALRVESVEGKVDVEVDGQRLIVTLPSEGELI